MQDIHSIAGGPIFVGSGGESTADRRLRPHHHPDGGGHHHHQSLKCPRCDSLNTKFCYYNNYNLSQPRHFCKNCRRYWTKGGVLRNVPVGGGCRKAKRSKTKTSAPAEPVPGAAETAAATEVQGRDRKTSSHSSSESSSLTATTTAAAGDAVSATSSISPSSFFSIQDYKSMIGQGVGAPPPPPPNNPGFDQGLIEQSSGCGLFSDIGNFTGMMASSAEQLPFGFGSVLDQNTHHWSQHQEQKAQHGGEVNIPTPDSGAGMFLGQTTVHVDLPGWQGRPSSGSQPFGALDWQPAADQGLFDLPGTVEQSYWGHQSSHWTDEDHQPSGLYLP